MKKILIIILIISCAFLPSMATAQQKDDVNPPQPGPEKRRPDNCVTRVNNISEPKNRCATISGDGTKIYLWYKPGTEPKYDVYDYVAISEKLRRWANSDRAYVFRANRSSEPFYILVDPDSSGFVRVIAHYQTSKEIDWNINPSADQYYSATSERTVPSGTNDKGRYSWRIVLTGKVNYKLNETSTPASANKAQMQIRLDGQKGPNIGEIESDDQGNFEFSQVDTYVNDDQVDKLFLYTKYENNGIKLESDPEKNPEALLGYLDNNWHTNAKDDKSKVRDGINITLTKTVDKFWDPTQGAGQSITKEIGNPWEIDVFKKVACWFANAFITVLYWEANFAGYFLRRNY